MSNEASEAPETLSAQPAPAPQKRKFGAKGIFAAVLGNGFEFYDFGVYAAYAVMIGNVFFPSDSKFASLMASVATFGAGFVARPLGGMFIGAFGDRVGRKPAMMLTIVLMALGSGMIGILPGYASIGLLAPVLLVVGRLIQGFAAGGEVGAATMFMLESAPSNKRCFYGSWQSASQAIANIVVGIIGFTLASAVSKAQLNDWGWRIPFLLGILIAPVGMYIRNKLDETAEHTEPGKSTGAVVGDLFGGYWPQLLLTMGIISGGTISTYFLINMTSYAITELHLPAAVALAGPFIGGVAGAAGAVSGGIAADRIGLKWVGIVPRLLFTAVAWPLMAWVVAAPGAVSYFVMLVILTVLNGASASALILLMPYFFPPQIRSTGLSVSYALGVMLFGGTAMPILTWLVHSFNDPLAGVYYVIVSNLVVAACVMTSKVNHISAPLIDAPPAFDDELEQFA
jgi:MFS family permease